MQQEFQRGVFLFFCLHEPEQSSRPTGTDFVLSGFVSVFRGEGLSCRLFGTNRIEAPPSRRACRPQRTPHTASVFGQAGGIRYSPGLHPGPRPFEVVSLSPLQASSNPSHGAFHAIFRLRHAPRLFVGFFEAFALFFAVDPLRVA